MSDVIEWLPQYENEAEPVDAAAAENWWLSLSRDLMTSSADEEDQRIEIVVDNASESASPDVILSFTTHQPDSNPG
jgi:hypothetical protein